MREHLQGADLGKIQIQDLHETVPSVFFFAFICRHCEMVGFRLLLSTFVQGMDVGILAKKET